jgi:hypothetical protein
MGWSAMGYIDLAYDREKQSSSEYQWTFGFHKMAKVLGYLQNWRFLRKGCAQ